MRWLRARLGSGERGSALVLAILIPFRQAIVTAVQNALASVTSGG